LPLRLLTLLLRPPMPPLLRPTPLLLRLLPLMPLPLRLLTLLLRLLTLLPRLPIRLPLRLKRRSSNRLDYCFEPSGSMTRPGQYR
jgi:hypothetical protein